jgi:hypothetical protein
MIINHGADINAVDDRGRNCLLLVVVWSLADPDRYSFYLEGSFVLKSGINPVVADNTGLSVMQYLYDARVRQSSTVCKWLSTIIRSKGVQATHELLKEDHIRCHGLREPPCLHKRLEAVSNTHEVSDKFPCYYVVRNDIASCCEIPTEQILEMWHNCAEEECRWLIRLSILCKVARDHKVTGIDPSVFDCWVLYLTVAQERGIAIPAEKVWGWWSFSSELEVMMCVDCGWANCAGAAEYWSMSVAHDEPLEKLGYMSDSSESCSCYEAEQDERDDLTISSVVEEDLPQLCGSCLSVFSQIKD